MLELRLVPAVLDTGGLVQPAVCRPRARINWAAPPGFRGAPGSCKRLLVRGHGKEALKLNTSGGTGVGEDGTEVLLEPVGAKQGLVVALDGGELAA